MVEARPEAGDSRAWERGVCGETTMEDAGQAWGLSLSCVCPLIHSFLPQRALLCPSLYSPLGKEQEQDTVPCLMDMLSAGENG